MDLVEVELTVNLLLQGHLIKDMLVGMQMVMQMVAEVVLAEKLQIAQRDLRE